MKIAKVGDTIQWSFDKFTPLLAGKTFKATVELVRNDEKDYGVYADYGQDFIPFDHAEIIANEKCNPDIP